MRILLFLSALFFIPSSFAQTITTSTPPQAEKPTPVQLSTINTGTVNSTTTEVRKEEQKVEPVKDNSFADEFFKEEENIIFILKSQGIDPTSLKWNEISIMCSNLENLGVTEQNKCKYDRARTMFAYTQENSYCKKFSEVFYSSHKLSQGNPKRYMLTDPVGRKSQITLTPIGNTLGEIKDLQTTEYLNCMKSHGWVNPDNWKAGKSAPVNLN